VEGILCEVGNIFNDCFKEESFYIFGRIAAMYKTMEYKKADEEACLSTIDRALQVLGGKWSFLVLAQLYLGPLRFNQLRKRLGDINTKSLTDTLRHLEQNKIIQRKVYPTVPVTVEYSLTEKGKDFQGVLIEMYNWGQKWGEQQDEGE
jgi:DNA-binding HxlR family transcriptional regulator